MNDDEKRPIGGSDMKRLAQMPPAMPPAMPGDPMGGMPPPGMDPMGGMGTAPPGMDPMGGMPPPMGAAPMGMPPAPAPTGPPPIAGPIDSIGEIVYDANLDKYIAEHTDEDENELALSIWLGYGGNEDGTCDPKKVGRRDESDADRPPEAVQQEIKDTDDRKWERLEEGKTIADITSLDEVVAIMKTMVFGTVKRYSTPPPPPPGAAPPMM